MSVVSENFVSHWSCVVVRGRKRCQPFVGLVQTDPFVYTHGNKSSDCEKSDGSGHDADSDEYGDEETDVGGSKLTREADDLETTVQS